MRWCLAFALSACSFAPNAAIDGGSNSGTPDAPDAPPGLPGDRDGDGVPDESDNCPDTYNPDQHNQDGDPFGDACDLCPHIASQTPDADSDGDMIGDPCDPRPNAKDTLRLFTGFYSQDDIAGWDVRGTWTFDGKTAAETSDTTISYLSPPMTYTRAVVQAGVVVDNVPNADNHGFGVVTGSTGSFTNPDQAYFCFLLVNGGNEVYDEARDGTNPAIGAGQSWPAMFTGSTEDFVLNVDGPLSCRVHSPTVDRTITGPTVGPSTGRVNLVAQEVSLRFDYVFIVELGN
jgi:hypothetical protein